MTDERYIDVDVPFCVLCSRFMMIKIGLIKVHCNYESDEEYGTREGLAFKCPQCGNIVIYKWTGVDLYNDPEIAKKDPYWYIFLEDHTHYNKRRGDKSATQNEE